MLDGVFIIYPKGMKKKYYDCHGEIDMPIAQAKEHIRRIAEQQLMHPVTSVAFYGRERWNKMNKIKEHRYK